MRVPITAEYCPPKLKPISYDIENAPPIAPGAVLSLSHKDVLGIVHAAFEALDPKDRALSAVKERVLDDVAAGRLAQALRNAIIGAARSGR